MCDGGLTTVHTLHGPWEPRSRAYYDLVHENVHLVAISETQRRANPDIRYAATIPNGIDLERYPLYEGERDDFVVYIGRANRDKAPELAIEVAHQAGLPIKLLVKRAEPAEKRYWQEHVLPRLGPGRPKLLDEITHDEKIELLQRGRAFVFPIRWEEPFGLVMIEALAFGMPVIATPRGAATEIVENGVSGYLRHDLSSLADCLAKATTFHPTPSGQESNNAFSHEDGRPLRAHIPRAHLTPSQRQ